MKFKETFTVVVTFILSGCHAKIENSSIYGEYSLVVDGTENILMISPNGTYTQKKIIDGKTITVNSRNWKDYSPDDDDIRYSLVGFQFPSNKSSGEWHAQLGKTWGKLSLCYFNDGGIDRCYVKRKPSS